jgi:hypothetical protein
MNNLLRIHKLCWPWWWKVISLYTDLEFFNKMSYIGVLEPQDLKESKSLREKTVLNHSRQHQMLTWHRPGFDSRQLWTPPSQEKGTREPGFQGKSRNFNPRYKMSMNSNTGKVPGVLLAQPHDNPGNPEQGSKTVLGAERRPIVDPS